MSETTAGYRVKNEYQYIEEELNRPIAQKLVLELFLGRNMVPRKKIIEEVYKTHIQRGGDSVDNPTSVVRGALDNLLDEGKVTRPQKGYYSFPSQNPPEQPEPTDEDEVNRWQSAIENEIEFITNQISQLEDRKSKLLHKLDEL